MLAGQQPNGGAVCRREQVVNPEPIWYNETTEYLELFLRNLLLDEKNDLKSRMMHIGGTFEAPKCQAGTLDVTLEEMQILSLLKKDSKLTQKQLAELIGKSDRTVKRITVSLEEKGLIARVGGKRFGYWKVNTQ